MMQMEVLRWATKARAELKGKIDALNAQVKTVNETAQKALVEAGIQKWSDNAGTISIEAGGEVATLKKDKLIYAMLGSGIPAEKVEAIIEAGTVVTQRAASVKFRPSKPEE